MDEHPAPGHASSTGERTLVVVPARLGSRRLARKMLLDETGTCLFVHTARNAQRCKAVSRVVVATDSEEILARAREAGVEALPTSADHQSGSDRVNEALGALGRSNWDVVVNVQGDEPELDVLDLQHLVEVMRANPEVQVATLGGPLDAADAGRPQVVKLVRDAAGDALYFSRAPIPYRPGPREGAAYAREDAAAWQDAARRHIGVYAYRPAALERFCGLPRGRLEALENLEQLRWLEAGGRMRVVEAAGVPLGIDTREDYDAFVRRVRNHAAGANP